MRSYIVFSAIINLQNDLYKKLNTFSITSPNLGRFYAIPLSIVDTVLDVAKPILSSIEYLAMTIINLIGAMFSDKFTLKHSLLSAERTLGVVVHIPVALVVCPLKLIFQLFAGVIDPATVKSIHHPFTYDKKDPLKIPAFY